MCVKVSFFFFQVRLFFDISLSVFFTIFYTGSCNVNEHFGYTFFSISIGTMMPFWGVLTFRNTFRSWFSLFLIFGTFTARCRGSWRGRCCKLLTQLSTWGSFFSVVLFSSLKLGSLRLKRTNSFVFGLRYWLGWNEKLLNFFRSLLEGWMQGIDLATKTTFNTTLLFRAPPSYFAVQNAENGRGRGFISKNNLTLIEFGA